MQEVAEIQQRIATMWLRRAQQPEYLGLSSCHQGGLGNLLETFQCGAPWPVVTYPAATISGIALLRPTTPGVVRPGAPKTGTPRLRTTRPGTISSVVMKGDPCSPRSGSSKILSVIWSHLGCNTANP